MLNFTDLLLDAVCLVDEEGRVVFISAACERIFGYTPDEMLGRVMFDMVLPEDRERTLQAAQDVRSGQIKTGFENRYIRKDGQIVHIMWSARWSEKDQLRVAVARDVTERKRVEHLKHALYSLSEAANASEDLGVLFARTHDLILEQMPVTHFVVGLFADDSDDLRFAYTRGEDGTLLPAGALKARSLVAQVAKTGQALFITPERTDTEHTPPTPEPAMPWHGLAAPLIAQNTRLGGMALLSDAPARMTDRDLELLQLLANQIAGILERNRMQARFRYLAQYDALTGLPNRTLFHDRLKTALERARRKHRKMALLYIDLDKFKQVNDSFGHLAGDALLQQVAQRLSGHVRESDTVARLGGDEFVIILEDAQTPEQAATVVAKIHQALEEPIEIDGHSLRMPASIGVAFYPDHGNDERDLLRHADRSMYTAKKAG